MSKAHDANTYFMNQGSVEGYNTCEDSNPKYAQPCCLRRSLRCSNVLSADQVCTFHFQH